jgi:exonuclease III
MNHYPVIRPSVRVASAVLALFLFFCPVDARAKIFTVASYNVENLFDLKQDATDYPEYIPDGSFGWNREMLDIKRGNIARVIKDLDAEIVALQEIESRQALKYLQERLARMDAHYAYAAIAEAKPTAVKCAMLSKFPMVSTSEIHVAGAAARSILKVVLDIEGRHLIVYINHWKSKFGPESQRLPYAKALSEDIGKLPAATDFILTGDFNSDYNEFETFRDIKRFNDTDGITGINHLLNTVKNGRLVDEALLVRQSGNLYLYNLWLELPEYRRWSVNFFGRKNSPDGIIVSKGLYDGQGIAYLDNSFDRYDPEYLFQNGVVYRWQRAESGRGKHLGHGYSDHLPVYARFTTRPFQWADAPQKP